MMANKMFASGRVRDANHFDIHQDVSPLLGRQHPDAFTSPQGLGASQPLAELPVDDQARSQRRPLGPRPLPELPELKSANRQRRPPIGTQTFRPLQEIEGGENQYEGGKTRHGVAGVDFAAVAATAARNREVENHPLAHATIDRPVEEQIKQQLSCQFDWVMTYPPPSSHPQTMPGQDGDGDSPKSVTYGCNLVRRKESLDEQGQTADTLTFLATRLDPDEMKPPSEGRRDLEDQIVSALSYLPEPTKDTLRTKASTESMELAASPSLTQAGGDASFASRGGSFSGARIEDSLEEIDKLEDDIEAVNNYTNSPRMATAERRSAQRSSGTPSSTGKTGKRVTIAPGQSATVRIKPSEKTRPALRRSNSMDLRENQPQVLNSVPEQKVAGTLSRAKPTISRTPESKTVRSSKPTTVPNFELPGEAVSRRLKEQREARLAQQAEAQKAYVAPPKPRSTRPLTKPNFELPGEAISRRKREEREAKLKAQEEEQRKRREFKARPIKSGNSNTLPRDTITSRFRQGKTESDESSASRDSIRSKRLSTSNSLSRLAAVSAAHSPQGRGRDSVAMPSEDGSRANSVSTSVSEKRSSVSFDDFSQQRLRGREVYARDNCYSQDREREKRGRESATRLAREQAAERSRAASREWAEKQRLRELARRESLRAQR